MGDEDLAALRGEIARMDGRLPSMRILIIIATLLAMIAGVLLARAYRDAR